MQDAGYSRFFLAYCVLPIAYCPLRIAYCLLPIAYCLLIIDGCSSSCLNIPSSATEPGDCSQAVLKSFKYSNQFFLNYSRSLNLIVH